MSEPTTGCEAHDLFEIWCPACKAYWPDFRCPCMSPWAEKVPSELCKYHVVTANDRVYADVVMGSDVKDHITDGFACWCNPDVLCAECPVQTQGPCIHGEDRSVVVVHKQAS